jgi:hypothetical protein
VLHCTESISGSILRNTVLALLSADRTTRPELEPAWCFPPVRQRTNAVLETALKRASVREQFARLGAEVRESTASDYADFIKREIARTAKIVRDAKITLD